MLCSTCQQRVDPRDDDLLPLLMADMTIPAIARQTGLSQRAVDRWIASLITDLDAAGRVHLGYLIGFADAQTLDAPRFANRSAKPY